MRTELDNYITIQMEIDYGRIQILRRLDPSRNMTRYIIRTNCIYGNTAKGGIERTKVGNATNFSCATTPNAHTVSKHVEI